jgi:hypothetical protein
MRPAGFALLVVLSLGVAGYALGVYGFLPLGATVHPDMRATPRSIAAGLSRQRPPRSSSLRYTWRKHVTQ